MADTARPEAEEVAPGVWRLPLRGVNAYALETEESATLVDAGNPGDGARILAMLDRLGLGPLRLILLTHGDVDHAGGLRAILRRHHAAVRTTEIESRLLAGGGSPSLMRRLGRLGTGRVRCAPAVAPGDHVSGLTVIATPGHTRGHCSYLRESDGVLFTGDALSVRDGAVRIPGQPFTEDWAEAYASLTRLAELHPTLLLPGHGQPLAGPGTALQAALETERRPRRRQGG